MKTYNIEEHIHRFGLWTAARAASKSLLSNEEVEEVIDGIGLRQHVELLRNHTSLDSPYYTQWLKQRCDELIGSVRHSNCNEIKKQRISYGLAAKVISIYIKTVEVIPSKGMSKFSEVAYPPIDSILLQNINKKYNKKLNTRWSKFNWEAYTATIEILKQINSEQPMWQLEAEWYNPKKLCTTTSIENL